LAALGNATQIGLFYFLWCHPQVAKASTVTSSKVLMVSLRNVTNVNDPLGDKTAFALATLGSTTRNRNNPICFMPQ
jgi:hypothetical protein